MITSDGSRSTRMAESSHLFGFCATPASDSHHARCPGTYTGQNGVTYICDCPNHQEEGMN